MATLEPAKPAAAKPVAKTSLVTTAETDAKNWATDAFNWFVKKQSFSNWFVVVIGVAAFVAGRLI